MLYVQHRRLAKMIEAIIDPLIPRQDHGVPSSGAHMNSYAGFTFSAQGPFCPRPSVKDTR